MSAPCSMPAALSSSVICVADICTTGSSLVAGSDLIRLHTSSPLMSGSFTSSSAMSSFCSRTMRSASAPVPASMTSNPSTASERERR
jgi:hypothetical protein